MMISVETQMFDKQEMWVYVSSRQDVTGDKYMWVIHYNSHR